MEDTLLPIFICVILPVAIVAIVMYTRQLEVKRKTEVMLRAIEAGVPVDTNLLSTSKKSKGPKSIKEELLEKLTSGCILTLMGAGFLALGIFRAIDPMFGSHTLLNKWWLPAGGVLLAVGISMLVSYFAGKKMLAKEIEAEEKALIQPQKEQE